MPVPRAHLVEGRRSRPPGRVPADTVPTVKGVCSSDAEHGPMPFASGVNSTPIGGGSALSRHAISSATSSITPSTVALAIFDERQYISLYAIGVRVRTVGQSQHAW
mgnify:CR=1 FL=1